ncbi:MAG TPA: hypothetical protein DCQ06_08770 [Myxococcales bacterium]|nr:hypothetical protein [Myxococcales bacterium]
MGKLLSIETGFTCNSRCKYCTQLDYRAIPQADKLDLTTEQIRERIRYAADNGYSQLGFSGGEPTIRGDFISLIQYAQQFEFERIGVTSNGRMFSYRKFTEEALTAGLDGFTFSLHGPTPKIHDRITKSPGSLEQALDGLSNIQSVCRKHNIRAHLMNNQIILPDNVGMIREMVELLAPLGIGLFMIQPFIPQRSNSDDLGRFYVPYEEIVASVERAVPALEKYGARIKPYNIPNCLFWHLGPKFIEAQFYGLRSFREYEQSQPGEFKAFRARQWYRIDKCKTCEEYCPGFRIEQMPQKRMSAGLKEAAERFVQESLATLEVAVGDDVVDGRSEAGSAPLIFSGTELFDRETIVESFSTMVTKHGPVSWMTALCEKVDRKEQVKLICDLTEAGALAELILITQPMDQRFLAQRVLEKGNIEELREGLVLLSELAESGRKLPRLRVLFNVGDLTRLVNEPSLNQQWDRLNRGLARASGRGTDRVQQVDAIIAISNFPRDQKPPDMRRQRDINIRLAKQLKAACELNRLNPMLAVLGDRRGLDAARADQMAVVERQFGEILPVESWRERLFRHPLSMPEMDFVSWSPPWLFERWDLSAQPGLPKETSQNKDQTGLRSQSVAQLTVDS